MSAEDRIRWDEAFRQRLHQPFPAPDPLLLQFTPPVDSLTLSTNEMPSINQDDIALAQETTQIAASKQPASPNKSQRALDLAAGFGQNGLWLAGQGYNVDIMDISRVALKRTRSEMAVRNLRNVNLLQMDVDKLKLEPETYALICVFRYLKRSLFPLLKLGIRPGGRIIYETYNRRYLDILPAFNQAFLLEVGELPDLFSGWEIRHQEEEDHNSRIVAIKPY